MNIVKNGSFSPYWNYPDNLPSIISVKRHTNKGAHALTLSHKSSLTLKQRSSLTLSHKELILSQTKELI